jgi:hypothetical protein
LLASLILWFVYLNAYSQVASNRNWVDSDLKFTDSKGNVAKIIHSFPRGGGEVYKNGKKYSYVVFWTRVFNQSATPLELKVKFPEVTFFNWPDDYIRIVLPEETMLMDKVHAFDYGLTHLQSFLNDKSNQLNSLQKRINPNQEHIFYIIVFMHIKNWGPARAKFELKDQALFYKISMGADTTMIPCGHLYFKK